MSAFSSFAELRTLLAEAAGPDADARAGAEARNAQLTKPPAALGRLEDLAIWYASWRGTDRPHIAAPQIIVFAGNHGITAQGVSAFPAEVTAQMVLNFQAGGAAINQLAKAAGARLDVHALDLETPTEDFTQAPAMSEAACLAALYIAGVCLLPEIFRMFYPSIPFNFGGTSLLILVVVTMDFMSQMQAHAMSHQYEGMMKKANLRNYGRGGQLR